VVVRIREDQRRPSTFDQGAAALACRSAIRGLLVTFVG